MDNDSDIIKWLRINRTPGVGPTTFFQLMSFYNQNIDYVTNHLSKILDNVGKSLALHDDVERELYETRKLGGDILISKDNRYSKLLKLIHNPPPVLSFIGNIDLVNLQCLAVVGSRSATINGKTITNKLISKLTEHKICIVSGLAMGIDVTAHSAAIDCGGNTIAVLGSGIGQCYPASNMDIYKKIINTGNLIFSEFALNEQIKKSNFPRRNRIISGLSYGVVVIEANKGSGSLITASIALNQGREVFAVPGSPLDYNSTGTNNLIKDGAIPVTSSDDIINYLYNRNDYVDDVLMCKDTSHNNVGHIDKNQLNELKNKILNSISANGTKIESVINEFNCDTKMIYLAIIELEVECSIYRDLFDKIFLRIDSDFF